MVTHRRTLPALAVAVLLVPHALAGPMPGDSPNAAVAAVVARRCSVCHGWARDPDAVAALRDAMAARVERSDGHVLGRLEADERHVVRAWLVGADVPVPSSWATIPVTSPTAGGLAPFTPEELGGDDPLPSWAAPPCLACEDPGTVSGDRARGLAELKLHCGRCHAWAARPNLLLRERERLLPRIRRGHGLTRVSKDRRQLMERSLELP